MLWKCQGFYSKSKSEETRIACGEHRPPQTALPPSPYLPQICNDSKERIGCFKKYVCLHEKPSTLHLLEKTSRSFFIFILFYFALLILIVRADSWIRGLGVLGTQRPGWAR